MNNGQEKVASATLEKVDSAIKTKPLISLKEIKAESSSESSSEESESDSPKINLGNINNKKIQPSEEIKNDRKDSLKLQKANTDT